MISGSQQTIVSCVFYLSYCVFNVAINQEKNVTFLFSFFQTLTFIG